MKVINFLSMNNFVKVFFVVFIFVLLILFITIIKNIKIKRNSKSKTKAKIVAKRTSLYSAIKFNEHGIYHNSPEDSCYYIIFQLENGKREELKVPIREYGIMVVGDIGTLVTEGDEFVEFRRYG